MLSIHRTQGRPKYVTISWNSVEALIALVSGFVEVVPSIKIRSWKLQGVGPGLSLLAMRFRSLVAAIACQPADGVPPVIAPHRWAMLRAGD